MVGEGITITSTEYVYRLTDKFSYDSLELVSTLEMIFHQAFSEILAVTTDKEVQFLMAKGRNDQKLMEEKEKQINRLENEVKELKEKHKHQATGSPHRPPHLTTAPHRTTSSSS